MRHAGRRPRRFTRSDMLRDLLPVLVLVAVALLDGLGGVAGFAVAFAAYGVALIAAVRVWPPRRWQQ